MTVDLADAALDYAARGWPVFPLLPGQKVPATPHGLKDATCDPDRIASWWRRNRAYNVGLRTGVAIDALDVDGPAGLAALDALCADREPVLGPTVATGKGGWHCYVAVTAFGNRARFVAGCDWRGAGGYVVAPPSIHPNGRPYQWLEGYGPGFPTLAAPAWLLEALRRPEAPTLPPERRPSPPDGYVRVALEREAGAVLAAPAGQRNDRLNRAAYNLGQLVGAGHIDAPAVVDALVRAALAAGLEERETERTIVSGLKSGMRHPRAIR